MKWISLKIYLLPLVMQEVDTVIEKYINIINELRRTNDQEIMSEFEDLRDSITKRIHELEIFYEDNIHDLRITNFEKVRLRLKKLLMYDIETLNKIENTSEFNKNLNYGYKGEKQQTEQSNNQSFKNNVNSHQKSNQGQTVVPSKNVHKKIAPKVQTDSPKKKIPSNSSKPVSNESPSKLQKDNNLYGNIDLHNAGISKNDSGSLKEINKWKEIVFKIKLTEKEYELLLKEKSKLLNL